MKLKIVFCEPPVKNIQAFEDEKLIIIQSPYKIIQAELGDTREYEKSDELKKHNVVAKKMIESSYNISCIFEFW